MTILTVDNLVTQFFTRSGVVTAVDGVSFDIKRGEIVGLVGESGSGKSVTGFSLLGLVDQPGRVTSGSIRLGGEELVGKSDRDMRAIRGARIAMVFQDPLMTLNPVITIGAQMRLAIRAHGAVSRRAADERAAEFLTKVGIREARARLSAYPHEFSGGMRQRVAIAIALLLGSELIVADEPTTALDVSIQAQILDEVRELAAESGTALLWISHDLAVVASLASRVLVMYRGKIVETGPTSKVLAAPQHAYTAGLLASLPAMATPGTPLSVFRPETMTVERPEPVALPPSPSAGQPFVTVTNAVKHFVPSRTLGDKIAAKITANPGQPTVKAVDGVSLTIAKGETLGLVGESGSGKSTLGRMIAGILAPTSGTVTMDGAPVMEGGRKAGTRIQTVFQDPFASLDPRMRVGDIVAEGPLAHGLTNKSDRVAYVAGHLSRAGLDPGLATRFPHQFSGGQRQRIAIARALAMQPEVLVCDEPVSSLDVSIQAQIINLFLELKRDLNLTILFISHDLSVVRHLSDRIAIMLNGRIVEEGETATVYETPQDDYTKRLLAAVPKLSAAA